MAHVLLCYYSERCLSGTCMVATCRCWARVGGHPEERVGCPEANHGVASSSRCTVDGGTIAGGHHAHSREGVAVVPAPRHHRAIWGELEPECQGYVVAFSFLALSSQIGVPPSRCHIEIGRPMIRRAPLTWSHRVLHTSQKTELLDALQRVASQTFLNPGGSRLELCTRALGTL